MADNSKLGASQSGYPAGQKPRTDGGNAIQAQVFREKDARSRVDQDCPPRGYRTQPGGMGRSAD